MNITFRSARPSDRKVFDWKPYGTNQQKPSVVTINGRVVLMMGQNRTVLYQYGGGGVAEMIRAQQRVYEAVAQFTEADWLTLRRAA